METTIQTEQHSDSILDNLWCHLREQRPVTLYNNYKGVPVTYDAEVAMVSTEYVGFIAHPLQIAAIKLERQTYIQIKGIPDPIRANPISIDYTNRVVMVEKLKRPHVIHYDLNHSWITPDQPVTVELDSDMGGTLDGTLATLAALEDNLLHVIVDVPAEVPFNRQDEIRLTFKLPEGGDLVQVAGVVYSLTGSQGEESRRLEVEGRAALQDEIAILAYLAKQEDALISELEAIYMQLRKGRGLED
ncbi:hypothetical protein JR338_12035 [Chloroflexota bacterium]|nr:hypothetical protein JR338_12035 [Chloroflexota bacterium]